MQFIQREQVLCIFYGYMLVFVRFVCENLNFGEFHRRIFVPACDLIRTRRIMPTRFQKGSSKKSTTKHSFQIILTTFHNLSVKYDCTLIKHLSHEKNNSTLSYETDFVELHAGRKKNDLH